MTSSNQTPSNKSRLLAAGLTANWVADEENVSFVQCYGCGEELNCEYILDFCKCPACGEQFTLLQRNTQTSDQEAG